MIEKLMNLFERFVVAIEDIADTLARQEITGHPMMAGTPAQTVSESVEESISDKPDYASMNRETLVALCEQRNIEVPKGTKTTTLVKKLKSWDAVQTSTLKAETEKEDLGPAFPSEVEEEANPFEQSESEAAEELTHEVMFAALQDYYKAVAEKGGNGIEAVTELIRTHAGVTLVREIPADKRKAVYDAIQKAA